MAEATDERLDRLRALRRRYLAGEAAADLASEIGVTEKTLTVDWSRFGICREIPRPDHTRHDWKMSELRAISDRWQNGETMVGIADSLGILETTLVSALERGGFWSPEISRERTERLRLLRESEIARKSYLLRRDRGYTWKRIVEAVGFEGSPVTLRIWTRKYQRRNGLPSITKVYRKGGPA